MDIRQKKMYLCMDHNFQSSKNITINAEFSPNSFQILPICFDIILAHSKFQNLNKQQLGQFFSEN